MLYGRLKTLLTSPQSASQNKRARNRIRTVLLECELGEIIDISLSGMRIRARRKPVLEERPVWFSLKSGDDITRVLARPVWMQKCRGGHEIGVTFVNVTPEQSLSIARMARDCADTETLRPPE